MVFAINPTTEKTYEAFKNAAVAQNGSGEAWPSYQPTTMLTLTRSATEATAEGPAMSTSVADVTSSEVATSTIASPPSVVTAPAGEEAAAPPVETALPAVTDPKPVLDLGDYPASLLTTGLVINIPAPTGTV